VHIMIEMDRLTSR